MASARHRGSAASRTPGGTTPGEDIDVAAHFTDHPGLFMLNCHMLDHEMMAQFEVVAPTFAHGSHEEGGVPQP